MISLNLCICGRKRDIIKKTLRGDFFTRPTFWLEPKEYYKICSEINQIYETQYKGKRVAAHISFGIDGLSYIYYFENHGFDNYNIFMRVLDNH